MSKKVDEAKEVLRDIFKKKSVKPNDPDSKLKDLENEINELIGQIISEASPTEDSELEAVINYVADSVKLYPIKIHFYRVNKNFFAKITMGMFLWEKESMIELPILWDSNAGQYVQMNTGMGIHMNVLIILSQVIGNEIVRMKTKK